MVRTADPTSAAKEYRGLYHLTEETYELRVVFGTDNSEGLALSQGDRVMPQPLAEVIVHSIAHEITWPFGRGSLDGEPVP